ncbi:hypothetical protein M5D96_013568 [Drosophila gunungcola]|uniref:Uncharacterized protein n=1 Tax=Drosophila gunungcola TaxID=103775 RepID=A0A9P9YBL7_9MUSC|nr:hypothetical protein M5D96_013568 [Drosophila gunungcola]
MFSTSPQLPIKWLSVKRSVKTIGNIPPRYTQIRATQTGHWNGPIIALYLGSAFEASVIKAAQSRECPTDMSDFRSRSSVM